jgi:hypothetical protein
VSAPAIARLIDSGRLILLELEYGDRDAFEAAAALLGADRTVLSAVASGELDGVEVILHLTGGPPPYLRRE